jgi:hypothetical protein
MKKIIALFMSCFLITSTLFSQDSEDEFEFGGEHILKLSIPVIKEHNDLSGNIKAPQIGNELSLLIKRSNATIKAGLGITLQLAESSNYNELLSFYPIENSLSYSQGIFTATAGFQYFSWGTADKLNPTDNLNPRDYTYGADAYKIPLFALAFSLYPTDQISFQGVYVPFEQADDFPIDAADKLSSALFGRMHVQSLTLSESGSGLIHQLESIKGVRDVKVDELPFDPTSYLAGGRVRLMTGTFDLGLSYLYDIDPYYTAHVNLIQYSPIDTNTKFIAPLTPAMLGSSSTSAIWGLENIRLKRNRIHRIGIEAKTVVDRFGIWGEACYSLTSDLNNDSWMKRNHQIDWTIGLDFPYGQSDEHYINIQHIGKFTRDFDNSFYKDYQNGKPSATQSGSRTEMEKYYYRLLSDHLAYLTEGLFLGGTVRNEWSIRDGRFKPSIEALCAVPFYYDKTQGKRYGDFIGTAEIKWNVIDAVSISFGGQGYYSAIKYPGADKIANNNENRIGLYHGDSRIFLNGSYSWMR